MLNITTLDYLNYRNAFKGNYRKGVFALRALLENPGTAETYVSNVAGVSLVLGWPIGHDDGNSAELLELLLNSSVVDRATLTWMSQWYPDAAQDWDTMAGDMERATFMATNPLTWRSVGAGPVGAGKVIATLAGQSCAEFADVTALAASQTAMAAVAASSTAMAAVKNSPTAMAAVCASDVAVTKYAASAAGADYSKFDTFSALAADSTAMGKVAASETAMAAVIASPTALSAVVSSSTAMAAVAASSTAMAAVAASSTAMTVVAASQTAMTAVAASQTAMAAVCKSVEAVYAIFANPTASATMLANEQAAAAYAAAESTVVGPAVARLAGQDPTTYSDMSKIAASSTAMAAIGNSQTALNAVAASNTALDALYARKIRMQGASKTYSGKVIVLEISSGNAFGTEKYGYATLSDGTQPNWASYTAKYSFFKQFKKAATFIKNDDGSDDWIDYFKIS